MASIFTHPAIATSLFPWFKKFDNPKSVLGTGILLSILPDIDVVGLRLGIPYEAMFGHRGLSHSLFFAAFLCIFVAWIMAKRSTSNGVHLWLYFFICMASHGLLDALTNGGHGIAFFAPFSNERYFFPFQPVEVSSLSIRRFFQGQGIAVLKSEFLWIWTPCLLFFIVGYWKKKPKKMIFTRKK